MRLSLPFPTPGPDSLLSHLSVQIQSNEWQGRPTWAWDVPRPPGKDCQALCGERQMLMPEPALEQGLQCWEKGWRMQGPEQPGGLGAWGRRV